MIPTPRHPSLCVLLAVAVTTAFAQSQPTTYTVNEGEGLILPCGGDSALFYMWKINGTEIEGAVTGDGSLVIPSANHSLHDGTFTCTAFLKDNSRVEFEYIVSVYYIDPIHPILRRTYPQCVPHIGLAYLNGSVTLECIPPDGKPMVNVTWYRNDQKLRQRDNPTIDFSNRRRMMMISPIDFAHIGDYHCEAANTVNEDNPLLSEVLHLSVEEAHHGAVSITIIDEEEPLIVGPGLRAEIVCKILPADAPGNVHWYHDNTLLNPHDNLMFEQGSDELNCLNSLIVKSVTSDDEGIYECRHGGTTNIHAQRSLVLACEI